MTGHSLLFLTAVLIFVGCLATTAIVYLRRGRSVSHAGNIGALLDRLTAIDHYKLAQIANGLPDDPALDEEALDAWQVWELTGGLAGIEALAANCNVLIDLACHIQEWYPEALPVTEQLRLNAREIQWHLERLRAAGRHGHQSSAYPEYAQRAVAIYLSMTRHVLDLYEAAGMPALPQLQAAL